MYMTSNKSQQPELKTQSLIVKAKSSNTKHVSSHVKSLSHKPSLYQHKYSSRLVESKNRINHFSDFRKMAKESSQGGEFEWRVNMPDGTSKVLISECTSENKLFRGLKRFFMGFVSKICGFFQKVWKLAVSEPRKVIHCFKVGMALSLVSLFYYMRPLYDGVGGNAMWAVMTVVVVFEYTVGSTLYKCVNRAIGTTLAGALGLGVHWIAAQSGERFEPIILQASVFFLAVAATFSRFIPSIKARFDYGAMIFILTFSLVSISGYRVDKLFEMAHHRLSTIAIGASICLIITMLLWPVWAGNELHNLVRNNVNKLADSLDGGCVTDYFRDDANSDSTNCNASNKKIQGYKCVLNSKATEESLANFARWEPAHGSFNFGHPWKQYLKVGASLRSCAYFIEALNGSISSGTEAPDFLKKYFSTVCTRVSIDSSAVLKELAVVITTMRKSSKIDYMIEEMNSSVEELQNKLKSFNKQPIASTVQKNGDTVEENANVNIVSVVDIVPLVTISSLLIEIAARTEEVAKRVNGLAEKAEFKIASDEKTKKSQNQNTVNPISEGN